MTSPKTELRRKLTGISGVTGIGFGDKPIVYVLHESRVADVKSAVPEAEVIVTGRIEAAMTIEPKLMSSEVVVGIAEQLERVEHIGSGTARLLLAHIAAQEQRIAELEKQNERFVAIVSACDERGEVGCTVDALAECRLRLQLATELNVADRKRIAELEAQLPRPTRSDDW